MSDITYTLEYDGVLQYWQEPNVKSAEAHAQEWWANRWDDEPMKNCETKEDKGFIVGFDDDSGDEVFREEINLYYEYYHGDFKEHNTLGM